MTPRFVGTMILLMIVACLVAGVLVYPYLPATIISHWGAHGEANGSVGKFWGILIIPLIMLVLMGLWALLPRIDPIAPGFKGFRYVYDFMFFLLIAFLSYSYALMLGINAGLRLSMVALIMPAVAVLVFTLGALFPYLKRNWFVGIRTPWTISSDMVWNKTHRLGGTLFEIAGIFILIGAYFSSTPSAVWFIVAPIVLAALISVVYSYVLYHGERKRA